MIPVDAVWAPEARDGAVAAVAGAARLDPWCDEEPVATTYPQLAAVLRRSTPLVVPVGDGIVAVMRAGRRRAMLRTPTGRGSVPTRDLVSAVAAAVETTVAAELEDFPASVRQALLDVRLVDVRLSLGWRVRPAADAPWRVVSRAAHLWRWIAVVGASHLAAYGVFLALWAVVGGAAARGEADSSTVTAAVALLLALAPLRAVATWSAGVVTVEARALLKRRLLGGVLAVDVDGMRRHGAGHLLGVVLEAEALETLALAGGYSAVLAVVELAAAALALGAGIRSVALLSLLVAWVAATAYAGRVYLRRRTAWSGQRLGLTHDLVERVVGHRTRLAQEGPALHDLTDDEHALDAYRERARHMDRAAVVLSAVASRGWAVAGLVAVLVPLPREADPVRLAATLGGVLLAGHGLERLSSGLAQLTDAAVAWSRVGPAFLRRSRGVRPQSIAVTNGVEATGLSFGYDGRPVLRDVELAIRPGDRVLVEGRSAAGKSTLVALLGGIRQPTAGEVRGSETVTIAPQFHENHVLGASFAFNLLLGRRWPPDSTDRREAWELCHELGLGPLLAGMPAGIEQPVGEVGWQLSHGERSRLYVARALLTNASVVVLDESFAALDREALQRTLGCVMRRARALVVIAHE